MIFEIPNLFSPQELAEMNTALDNADWLDGKLSAGSTAQTQKKNSEVDPASALASSLVEKVHARLAQNEALQQIVMPTMNSLPIFSRYQKGMRYGPHLDISLQTYSPNPNGGIFPAYFRPDVSATLFLSEPTDYEGGELRIESSLGARSIKAEAGTLVCYPSNLLHEVTEVLGGERRVAILWFESYLPDPEQRQLLYNLRTATTNLMQRYPSDKDVQSVSGVFNNLVQLFTRK